VAAASALEDAGLAGSGVDLLVVANHGERRLPEVGADPTVLGPGALGAALADHVGAAGTVVVYGACAGGTLAIGHALEVIRSGGAEVALAGGVDCLLREPDFFHFCNLHAMTSRDCAPEAASCPFDVRRDGFVLGDGGAFVVLESEAHLAARGGTARAEVAGFGSSQNAYHVVASPPDAQGPYRAMAGALRDAGVDPIEVDYLNAHGTATRDNDWCETLAIQQLFGPDTTVPVSSCKSQLGHAMAGAGAIEAAVCVEALRHGVVPPTSNLDEPDPRCALDLVPRTARRMPLSIVVSNSFGFGGHCASLVLRAA
jgi:3-oxoacyl-[acyl-carrier-protein] synthase II